MTEKVFWTINVVVTSDENGINVSNDTNMVLLEKLVERANTYERKTVLRALITSTVGTLEEIKHDLINLLDKIRVQP